ncbi:uncharacterized protein [Euphorbia lathyris]|uniref:uncharacterized protein n=1 Tax=Euphorbia lathyris TaxID=212925 RepID=UPI00331436FD
MEKVTTITTLASRRSKWQYPTAQPTPRILHLPRRPRRKTPAKTTSAAKSSLQRNRKVKLETLFDEEREFSRGFFPVVMMSGGGEGEGERGDYQEGRRERVEERESAVVEEEKWRFQAEMLRAECNLLRMERAIAVKKMERRKVQVERALRSAVHTLLSGRKRICEGKNASIVLEEEIIELAEKLEKLQRRSKHKDSEVQHCDNFDKQASRLQTRIEKFAGESDEICVKEIQEMAEASLSITTTTTTTCSITENLASNSTNMEILRRKMEGLSRENLLDESTRRPLFAFEKNKCEERACCGCCKAIARRVVEQIRAETEQWSQMQEILGQVRDEMEELQASRAFWEDRALNSDYEIQSLRSILKEWRRKALASEAKANELQAQVSVLEAQTERNRTKNVAPASHDSSNEMEKRVLVCRLKENRHRKEEGCAQKEASGDRRKKTNACSSGYNGSSKRSPFREIGNSSQLLRQNSNNSKSRAVFPLHCPLPAFE